MCVNVLNEKVTQVRKRPRTESFDNCVVITYVEVSVALGVVCLSKDYYSVAKCQYVCNFEP